MRVALAFAIGILFAASLPFVVRAAGTDGTAGNGAGAGSAAGVIGTNKQGVVGGVNVKTGKVNSSARRVSHRKHVHRKHAFN